MNVDTKITIEHGGTSISMTIEEARDLMVNLDEITGRSSLLTNLMTVHAELCEKHKRLIEEHEKLQKELAALKAEREVTHD